MSLTSQQELFAQNVASGKKQSDAYRAAYPKSLKWKPGTVWKRASEMALDGEVLGRIQAIKAELSERGLWSKEDSVRALVAVVKKPGKASEVIQAVKELNAMHGFEAAKEVKHSPSVIILASRLDEDI